MTPSEKNPDDTPLIALLRLPQGPVAMADLDPDASPGYPGNGKDDGDEHLADIGPEVSDLQERLYASGRAQPESARRILVVLQGMDTSGKGGVIRHAIGLVDPQGVQLKSFKAPTPEERAHHYLWRIRNAVPGPGMIGIFDRSQYEDVLIVRVESLVPESEWSRRYDEINAFEKELVEQGTTIIKCFLHISSQEQKARLVERLQDPSKHWKYNPGDVDARAKWPAYMDAYQAALERCNTEHAPWHVIPSNKKWYRNWAVAQLLREHLAALDLKWPPAEFDVGTEIGRVQAT